MRSKPKQIQDGSATCNDFNPGVPTIDYESIYSIVMEIIVAVGDITIKPARAWSFNPFPWMHLIDERDEGLDR
jgi:hypothetical protein